MESPPIFSSILFLDTQPYLAFNVFFGNCWFQSWLSSFLNLFFGTQLLLGSVISEAGLPRSLPEEGGWEQPAYCPPFWRKTEEEEMNFPQSNPVSRIHIGEEGNIQIFKSPTLSLNRLWLKQIANAAFLREAVTWKARATHTLERTRQNVSYSPWVILQEEVN